jgi:hypothetical protein
MGAGKAPITDTFQWIGRLVCARVLFTPIVNLRYSLEADEDVGEASQPA